MPCHRLLITVLLLSLPLTYAQHAETGTEEEKTTQPTSLQAQIIEKDHQVELWQKLIKRTVRHQDFLKPSQNITMKAPEEWEGILLEVVPLFDEDLKNMILTTLNKDKRLPSLQDVFDNQVSDFHIVLILDITVQENEFGDISFNQIKAEETSQTLQQFLIRRALLLAKKTEEAKTKTSRR